MAIVNKVDQRLKVNIDDTIKYQILTYCFFKDILIGQTDLNMLCELAKNPDIELTQFCKDITTLGIFGSEQSARNAINKVNKKGLLIKKGKNKKTVSILKEINVQTKGLVLLDIKVLGSESEETQTV